MLIKLYFIKLRYLCKLTKTKNCFINEYSTMYLIAFVVLSCDDDF